MVKIFVDFIFAIAGRSAKTAKFVPHKNFPLYSSICYACSYTKLYSRQISSHVTCVIMQMKSLFYSIISVVNITSIFNW